MSKYGGFEKTIQACDAAFKQAEALDSLLSCPPFLLLLVSPTSSSGLLQPWSDVGVGCGHVGGRSMPGGF